MSLLRSERPRRSAPVATTPTIPEGRTVTPVWPRIWQADRRPRLLLLVGAGVAQAALAAAAAVLVSRSLRAPDAATRNASFGLLISVALVGGLLRAAERAVAERLGQSYVHDVRLRLLRVALGGGGTSSLGVTVSRATNDLSALKNWLALGLAPLVVGTPAVVGVLVVLGLTAPALALAVAVPVLLMAVASLLLTPWGFTRARELRRRRGRLASNVADTVLASATIRSGGGVERELGRLAGVSRQVADAAVARAEAAGALRGVGVATATASSAAVVWAGGHAGLPVATVAGALTTVGFLAGPLHDLSRVVDQRQSYRAARRALTPGLTPTVAERSPARLRLVAPPIPEGELASYKRASSCGLVVSPLRQPPGGVVPWVAFGPGERVLVTGAATARADLVAVVSGLRPAGRGEVSVAGHDLAATDWRVRRGLVGYAADGMNFVPGSLARTLGYRAPDTTDDQLDRALDLVGLGWYRTLPDGLRTRLTRDGAPFGRDERARLVLARALLGSPAVLVIDHLDRDLEALGKGLLRELVAAYPGVVVLATADPSALGVDEGWRSWGQDREVAVSAS